MHLHIAVCCCLLACHHAYLQRYLREWHRLSANIAFCHRRRRCAPVTAAGLKKPAIRAAPGLACRVHHRRVDTPGILRTLLLDTPSVVGSVAVIAAHEPLALLDVRAVLALFVVAPRPFFAHEPFVFGCLQVALGQLHRGEIVRLRVVSWCHAWCVCKRDHFNK